MVGEPHPHAERLQGVHTLSSTDFPRDARLPVAEVLARPEFTVFYNENYRRLVAAMSSTLGDRDLGVEAIDEAMARCYARWSVVGGYENPAGWVYRVGLNWALSWHRKLARRKSLPEPRAATLEPPVDPQILEALMELDRRLRDVVVCRILLDWSTKDTAASLGIKPGTVKSRLHRGLRVLEEALAAFAGDQ